ncbi:MAG TPA: TonB-dependent receptor [Vicinamibacterales bacterium]|nr:TonB-dependent receptor [Vicinamibacterales bacterium]
MNGAKADLADRLSLTAAVFHLTRDGGLVTDPSNVSFQIQTGEQVARSIEFDAVLQTPGGLSLVATYTLTDSEVTRDTAIPIGNVLMNVPRHLGATVPEESDHSILRSLDELQRARLARHR